MKSNKKTPDILKKYFIGSIVALWLTQTVQLTALMAMQYPSNPNLSGFVPWILSSTFVPVIIVAAIFLTRKRRAITLQSVFDVTLVAVTSMALFGVLSTVNMFYPPPSSAESVLYYQILATAMPLVIVVAVTGYALLRLRRSGQW